MPCRSSRQPVDILIAQTDDVDVALTRRALVDYGAANGVHVVRDGSAVLDFLFGRGAYAERRDQSPLPRIILLDLRLPTVCEVLRQVKADPRTRMIPIAVLTASNAAGDMAACYDLGANSYVVKPAEFEKYVQMLRRLITYWLLINRSTEALLT